MILVGLFFWIVLSLAIAFAGSEREIGFWVTLFAGLIFSPLLALIIVALSARKQKQKQQGKLYQRK